MKNSGIIGFIFYCIIFVVAISATSIAFMLSEYNVKRTYLPFILERYEEVSDIGVESISMPKTKIVSSKYLKSLYDISDETLAIYVDSKETVYIAIDRLRSIQDLETVFVHELVHHVQKVSGIMDEFNCVNESEPPAYLISNDWIDHNRYSLEKADEMFIALIGICFDEYQGG